MRRALVVRVALAVAVIGALFTGLSGDERKPEKKEAQTRAEKADVGGPFPLDLRSPQVLAGTSQRVLVALRRPSLGELQATSPQPPSAQRAYVRSLHREARALMSALNAKGIRFGRPVLFARVWSGFAATIATKDLPAVQTLGLLVEPVSRFYPAQVAAKDAPAVRPLPTRSKPGTVAVLDALPRRARAIADEVGEVGSGRPSPAERAGLRLESVVRRELPGVRITPIRVAGSQALESGRFQVFGTTDQLLAGLERAVDPDQNGDVRDRAGVALTGLSAPFSGFDDSPAADAVDAAAKLGTLVVAPAGNGGEVGGPFGTVGAPGSSAAALTVGALDGSGDPAPASSRGPTYGLSPKPDLAIGGGATTHAGAAWGTAIAAARVAGVAAALRAERPSLSPADTAGALVGTAAPRGSLPDAGGGDPLLQAARATQIVAAPRELVIHPGRPATVRIANVGSKPVALTPRTDSGTGVRVTPARIQIAPRRTAAIRIQAPANQHAGTGRIEVGSIAIPFQVVAAQPPAPRIGRLVVVRDKGRPAGVRFVAGAIKRGSAGPQLVPVGRLVLALEGPGRRELTPPGGARDLLPSEYAYTLTDEVLGELPPGRYRFVVRARGTAGGPPVVRRSPAFKIG